MTKNKIESGKITIRIPKELQTQYKQYRLTHARKAALNSIYLTALEKFLSPEEAEKQEAAIAKRLDRIDRRLKSIEKRNEILAETLALYIRGYLTISIELPDDQKPAALAQAGRRWKKFMEILADRLGGGKSLFAELQEDKIFKPEDFEQHPDENITDINNK